MNFCCFPAEIKTKGESPDVYSPTRLQTAGASRTNEEVIPPRNSAQDQVRGGRPPEWWTNSEDHRPPASPKTPVPSPLRTSNRLSFTRSTPNGLHSGSSSTGSYGTHSSGGFSQDSNVSRPRPVEDLHHMVTDAEASLQSLDGGAQKAPSRSTDIQAVKAAKRSSESNRWKAAEKGQLGTPIKMQVLQPQLIRDGEPDPLGGNRRFKVLQRLAPGATSLVYLCTDLRDQAKVAIKLVTRGVSNAKAAEREVANLRLCGLHPYIIHMREVFLTDSHLAIVFDYAPGGNLAGYIETFQSSKPGRGLSEERTRSIFRQIVIAVDFCHKMGIANRDIKLENVLLIPARDDPAKPPDVKLSDFGFSKDELADSLCKTACGTPESVAPEILSGELYDGKSSDIWSLGVLLFTMLTGTFPFSRPSDDDMNGTVALRKLFLRISKAQYPIPTHVSRPGLNLLDQMLQVDPIKRIDIAGIMSHPWFGSSVQDADLNVNQGLLDMPDAMITGFATQSEDEIASIIKASAQRSVRKQGMPTFP